MRQLNYVRNLRSSVDLKPKPYSHKWHKLLLQARRNAAGQQRGEGRGRRKRNRELGGKKIKRQRNWRIHKGLNGLNAVKGQAGRVYSRAVGVAKWPIKNVSNVASIGGGGRV